MPDTATPVRSGERRAFEAVVREHDSRLRALAYKLLAGDRDRMDDALQEAYVKAYRSYDRFRGDADVGTWLHRIVYNACIDELRRGRRRPEPVELGDAPRQVASTAPGPERTATTADAVLRGLAMLPDDQRIAVVLVDGEGVDNLTASRLLGVPPGTVASRLSRARATLRTILAEEER